MRFYQVWLGAVIGAALSWTAPIAHSEPVLAKIMPVTAVDGVLQREFFGRVVAKQTVDLAFQVGGQILEFPATEGEFVPTGSTIAALDLEPFELSLAQAQAQLDQATRTLERFEKLSGSSVSQVSVDDARTQADLADIALRNAQRSLKLATLTAPFDALIASRQVSNFTSIGAGTPVVRMHDMSEIRIEIDVPEVLFQRAGEDADVKLEVQFPASDRRFPVTVREFNAETTQVGQTFRITLGMVPPDGLVILPGSSAQVTAELQLAEPRVLIPASAVIIGNDGTTSVALFEPAGADEGTVRRVPVEVSPDEHGAVSVTSGLEGDQEIIASGATALEDGASVRRFTGFSN